MLLLVEALVIPTPFLNEVIDDELNTPASLFVDLVDDGENFFLFGSVDETFSSVMDRAESYACNAPTPKISDLT